MQSTFLLLFFFLVSFLMFSSPSSSSPDELVSRQEMGSNSPIVTRYQQLSAKNDRPFLSSNRVYFKKRKMKLDRPKRGVDDGRQYSVMLPKGLAPPSGSSPCHNRYPDSITLYCELSFATASFQRSGTWSTNHEGLTNLFSFFVSPFLIVYLVSNARLCLFHFLHFHSISTTKNITCNCFLLSSNCNNHPKS